MNLERLAAELAVEEGDRLAAYLDTKGILTIGRGHNCIAKPVPRIYKVGDRITPEQDDALFAADLAEVEKDLDRGLSWWRDLDDVRQNVIADMRFNMGMAGLMTFGNTLRHVHAGEYAAAAYGMRHSLWDTQVGHRAERLAHMMETGCWPEDIS